MVALVVEGLGFLICLSVETVSIRVAGTVGISVHIMCGESADFVKCFIWCFLKG